MSNPLTRNFPERMLILPHSRTKTDTPHLMPLSEPAMAVLKSVQQNGSEFVFPTVTGLKIANWSFWKRRLDSTLGSGSRRMWLRQCWDMPHRQSSEPMTCMIWPTRNAMRLRLGLGSFSGSSATRTMSSR
jgi:hypothetical protein